MPRFDAARRAMDLLRELGRSATPRSANPCGETTPIDPRPDALQAANQACQDGDRPFREAMSSWVHSIQPVYPMSDEELQASRENRKKGKPRVLVCGRIANLDRARQPEPKKTSKKTKKAAAPRPSQIAESRMTATAPGYIYTPYMPLITTNGGQEPQFTTRVVRARPTNASGSDVHIPTYTVTGPGLTPEELERQVQDNQERRDQIGQTYEQLMEEFETDRRRLYDRETELIARAEQRLEEHARRLEFEEGLRRMQERGEIELPDAPF